MVKIEELNRKRSSAKKKFDDEVKSFEFVLEARPEIHSLEEAFGEVKGLKFTSIPSLFEENLEKSSFSGPSEYAKETARQKALEVYHRVKETAQPHLVVAVDTVVFADEKIIEKPKDEKDAFQMIKSFSGRTHSVHSGVALLKPNTSKSDEEHYSILQFDEVTKVTFGSLTDEIIKTYVATKEPLDKAGGYGIQSTGLGGSFVKSISGDYFNVMGFPLHQFCVKIRAMFEDTYDD